MSGLAGEPDTRVSWIQAASLVAAGFGERAEQADQGNRFLEEDLKDLRTSGLLGLLVPPAFGGLGAHFADYAAVAMTLATGNAAPALVYNMHASVTGALATGAAAMTLDSGAEDARAEALMAAASGEFFAVAMSERGSGARLSSMATTYEQVNGGFLLTGTKAFVSGAELADRFLVAARSKTDPSAISFFLVPKGCGVSVKRSWDPLGMRATGSDDVDIEAVVPQRSLLGGVEGIGLAFFEVMPQWLVASYAAVYVGLADSALAAAARHCGARGLGGLPAVRARLGRADASTEAARLAVLDAARRVDDAPGADETNRAVYRAKLLAGDNVIAVASSMLEAAGASSTRRGTVLERCFRDARCGALQPATSDVCADWLGLAALGLDPNRSEIARW